MNTVEIDTPTGPARAYVHPADAPRAALVLGHGAGGGVEAPDLVATTEAAVPEGFTVALVEQPYRVAGRKSPAPAKRLDEAWIAVVEHLTANELSGLPVIVGGRSVGARVACRCLPETGGLAVLCLAFPLQPPARKGKEPSPDRLPELEAVDVPVLVVQGDRDRFGMPPPGSRREVVTVAGDHSLRTDPEAVADAVRGWLRAVVKGAAAAATR
jgi:predicted alpha/beta-hydrolase family hydrolase